MDKATGSNARDKKPVSQIVVIVSKYGQNFEFSLARKVALPHPNELPLIAISQLRQGIIVFTLFHGTPDGSSKHQLHFFAERGRISETSGFDPRIVLFLPIPTYQNPEQNSR